MHRTEPAAPPGAATPETFELEPTTVWSFPARGAWATHRGDYRGNWPPQVPRNLILRYTRPGDQVLDPMCGSGTTLIECRLLGRNGIGLDINPRAVALTRERIRFPRPGAARTWQRAALGDARRMALPDASVDLVTLHPPYHGIIRYSEPPIEGDLSHAVTKDDFIAGMTDVARDALRVLRPGGFLGILMGDTRARGLYVPLAFETLRVFLGAGFRLKEDVVKLQWNCSGAERWTGRARERGFLLIAHEHLFVLQKPRAPP